MKNKKIPAIALLPAFLLPLVIQAQEEGSEEYKPVFITVTQGHWNMDMEDFSMDKWKALATEYFNKVTMKNELILNSEVMMHHYTPDNSEILWISVYQNWEDIPKANKRNGELVKAAWPDETERKAFFSNLNNHYSNEHSDEIYVSMKNTKGLENKSEEPLIYYERTFRFDWPDDGEVEEFEKLHAEFATNIIHTNEDILAYYPMSHRWGSDGREFIEVFVVKSMAALEKINKETTIKAIQSYWPDEDKRKAFFKLYNRYTEPWHGDLIYINVPELSK